MVLTQGLRDYIDGDTRSPILNKSIEKHLYELVSEFYVMACETCDSIDETYRFFYDFMKVLAQKVVSDGINFEFDVNSDAVRNYGESALIGKLTATKLKHKQFMIGVYEHLLDQEEDVDLSVIEKDLRFLEKHGLEEEYDFIMNRLSEHLLFYRNGKTKILQVLGKK